MLIPFDISLVFSFVGILFTILASISLLREKNIVLWLVREIDSDLSKLYGPLLDKSRKYTHEKKLTGRKLKIHRLLGNFPEEKDVPWFVAAVAGMAVVALMYCLFFLLISYIYSGINNNVLIDWILIVGQISLIVQFLVCWFGKKFNVMYLTLYLIATVLLWLIGLAIGAIMSFTGLYFHIIPDAYMKWFYLSTLTIPFIPIIFATIELSIYFSDERKKYKKLNAAVLDFEEFKKSGVNKTKKS